MRYSHNRFVKMLAVAMVLPVTLTAFVGCSSPAGVSEEAVYQTADGVAMVNTFTTVATVTAIDATKRRVSMTSANGKTNTYKATPEIDLSRFRVGEQIGVRVTDELLLEVKPNGAPARDAVATTLATASDASGGAMLQGEAVETSATVTAIDPKTRTVTFQLADGTTKTMKAHSQIDLSAIQVGTTVIAKYAVSMVVAIANP
jgi:hypothetical protein